MYFIEIEKIHALFQTWSLAANNEYAGRGLKIPDLGQYIDLPGDVEMF